MCREVFVRFFVNADDFGMSQGVNDEILDLLRLGLVDSASIIANAPYADAAFDTAKAYAQYEYGVHLNLTEFKPLTSASELQPLLNAKGEFQYEILARTPPTSAFKRAVYREWRAQIDHFIAGGLRPAHLDSHHHVHLMGGLSPVIKRLQWRYGIKRLRGMNLIERRESHTIRSLVRKSVWRRVMRIDGTTICDRVDSLLALKEAVEGGELYRSTGPRRHHLIEIITHPGNTFDPQFGREVELLRSGWLNRVRDLPSESARQGSARYRRSARLSRSYDW
jgi:predicted glycoside hydrolase/deacetylase ChbG (UPF0249 family)